MQLSLLLAALLLLIGFFAMRYWELRKRYSASVSSYTRLQSVHGQFCKESENIRLVYDVFFKDVLEKSSNQEYLLEYLKGQLELVYKRTTIGVKGDDKESYTDQELLNAQTIGILRNIMRPFILSIDAFAGECFDKYQSK